MLFLYVKYCRALMNDSIFVLVEGHMILNKSIRTRLFFIFSIVFIISLGAITVLWYTKSSQTSLQLTRNSAFEIIKSTNDNFELTLKDVDYLSTVISLNRPNVIDVLSQSPNDEDYDKLMMDRKLDDFIESLYGYKFYISGILVCGENGKRYAMGSSYLQILSRKIYGTMRL